MISLDSFSRSAEENDPFEVKRRKGRKTFFGSWSTKIFCDGRGSEWGLAGLKWMHDDHT